MCRVGANTSSGCPSFSSLTLRPSCTTVLAMQVTRAHQFFFHGWKCSYLSLSPVLTTLLWHRLIISRVSVCLCLLTSFLASSLLLSLVSSVHGCQINLPEIPLRPCNFLASKLSLASRYWQRSCLPGAATFLSSFSPL